MFLAALMCAGLVQNDPAGAHAFMQQVLSVSQSLSLQRSARSMTYRKRLTVTDIEDDQNPVTEESKTWTSRAVGSGTMSRLIIRDGRTVPDAPETADFNMIEAMRTKYRFTWSPEPVTGEGEDRCFNIEFTPLNPDAKDASLEERIANHLTGTACIDANAFFVRRIEGHLYEPFKIRLGARMKRVHLTIVQRLVDGLPVYEWSRADLYYAFFGIDSVKRHHILYDSWQMAPIDGAPSP